jgi:hypothetical protein
MSVQLLSNVRAVTPSGVVDDATVAMEDGVIVGVEEGRSYLGAEDGRGAYCLPGLIDSHCDAIEREISPRPTAVFDFDFALRSLEQRFLGAGITTAYHGVRFADEGTVMRSLPSAARLVEVWPSGARSTPASTTASSTASRCAHRVRWSALAPACWTARTGATHSSCRSRTTPLDRVSTGIWGPTGPPYV